MCETTDKLTDIQEAEAAFHVVTQARNARKAFNFIDRYTEANGRRPSLSSIVMLWQEAEAKLDALQAEVDEQEAARGSL